MSRTIIKNELPPEISSWSQYVRVYTENHQVTDEIRKHFIDGKTYFINRDFAKARAYEELVLVLRKMLP